MIYLNGNEVTFGKFPNNEINLKLTELEDEKDTNFIKFIYENDEDIFKLALLNESLVNYAHLYISYMPYSRMDRVNGIYAVSLHIMAQLINDMNFMSVTVREPHSYETLKLLNNAKADWWCSDRVGFVCEQFGADTLLFPDKGAQDRYETNKYKFAVGFKKRNFLDASIEEYSIEGPVGNNVLIVDDLCSRGGTFVRAAKLLRVSGAKHIGLLVAHCENNVFTGEIFNYIDRIYTSHEMLDRDHPRVTKLYY